MTREGEHTRLAASGTISFKDLNSIIVARRVRRDTEGECRTGTARPLPEAGLENMFTSRRPALSRGRGRGTCDAMHSR